MAVTYEGTLVSVTPAAVGPPTLTEICPLTSTRFRMLEQLGAPGVCELDTPVDKMDPAGKARLRDLSVAPCELWVRRTTSASSSPIVFAGPVVGCRLRGRTLTVTAPGLLAYLGYWLADVNVITALNGSAATEFAFSSIDQATIVQRIADAWQGLSFGSDGIITSGLSATGIVRDLTLSSREGRFVDALFAEMGGRTNGFDLTVDPITRALTMWSPRKGNDKTGSVFLDSRSMGAPELAWGVAPGSIGSEVFASSTSATGPTLTSIATNAGLRATFGRSYTTATFQDISNQGTLDEHAARAAVDRGSQVFSIRVDEDGGLLPVVGFGYDDVATGDLITYDFDASLGRQTFTPRIATKETSTDSGREMLRVGFV